MIPKVDFLFADNTHIANISVPHYFTPIFKLESYGIENDKAKILQNFVVGTDSILQGDKALAESTKIQMNQPYGDPSNGDERSWVAFDILKDEKNDYLILTVYAYDDFNGNSAKMNNDKKIVEEAKKSLQAKYQEELDSLMRQGLTEEAKYLQDKINVEANAQRKYYSFKRNFLLVLQK